MYFVDHGTKNQLCQEWWLVQKRARVVIICKATSDWLHVIRNVKKIAFWNKEHTTDKKMGVSVLLRLFISSNEVCNTAYAH